MTKLDKAKEILQQCDHTDSEMLRDAMVLMREYLIECAEGEPLPEEFPSYPPGD